MIDRPEKPIIATNTAELQVNQSGSDVMPSLLLERRYSDTTAPKNSNACRPPRPPMISTLSPRSPNASKKKIAKTAIPDARRNLVARMPRPESQKQKGAKRCTANINFTSIVVISSNGAAPQKLAKRPRRRLRPPPHRQFQVQERPLERP